jgi:HK97 gp10 family phage protein
MTVEIKFNNQVWDKIIKEAQDYVSELAEEVKVQAKYGPDMPVLTGKLRDSIEVTNIDENTKDIGSEVFYAIYQEMGTVRNPPRAFLRNALNNIAEKIE